MFNNIFWDAVWILTLLAAFCATVGFGLGLFATQATSRWFMLPDGADTGLVLYVITAIIIGIDIGVVVAYKMLQE